MIPIHTILHPTDFSGHAELSFQLACSLPRDQGARLIVLPIEEQPGVWTRIDLITPAVNLFGLFV